MIFQGLIDFEATVKINKGLDFREKITSFIKVSL